MYVCMGNSGSRDIEDVCKSGAFESWALMIAHTAWSAKISYMLPVLSRGVGGPGIVAQHVGRLDADNALRQNNLHGVVCAPSMTILLCSPRG